MTQNYIIITDPLKIKNARGEVVYFFHAGERVEFEAKTEFYWVTRHGAVWFSQAKQVSMTLEQVFQREIMELNDIFGKILDGRLA